MIPVAGEFLDRLDDIRILGKNGLASKKVEVEAGILAGLIRTGDAMCRALRVYFLMGFVAGAILTAPLTALVVSWVSQPAAAAHANPMPGRRTK